MSRSRVSLGLLDRRFAVWCEIQELSLKTTITTIVRATKMNINPNINTAAQSTQGQNTDEMMTKLSQILANSGASATSGSEVKNEDLVLKETLSMAIQQQMGEPEAPAVGDEHVAAAGLTSGLAGGDNFQALMAKVLGVLIESSSQQSAGRREQRAVEVGQGLQNSLDAVEELKSGAAKAFVTSMVS
uniref:hypothetical protein n=1 Tax=Candidatus Ichthyocystis hellenicum TaxID=1561003 RepID=UPI0011119A1B